MSISVNVILNSTSGKSLASVSSDFVSGDLSCFAWDIFIYSFFLTFCVGFCTLDKKATLPVLKEWFLVDEPHQLAQPELLVACQTFLIVQLPSLLFLMAFSS